MEGSLEPAVRQVQHQVRHVGQMSLAHLVEQNLVDEIQGRGWVVTGRVDDGLPLLHADSVHVDRSGHGRPAAEHSEMVGFFEALGVTSVGVWVVDQELLDCRHDLVGEGVLGRPSELYLPEPGVCICI